MVPLILLLGRTLPTLTARALRLRSRSCPPIRVVAWSRVQVRLLLEQGTTGGRRALMARL